MMRTHRFLRRPILSMSLAVALAAPVLTMPVHLLAQSATPPADVAPDKALLDAIDTFWHYGKIARYDLAVDAGNAVLDNHASDPVAFMRGFEAVAQRRGDNLDQWLLRWQRVDAMRETSTRIIQTLSAGYEAQRSDPNFIEATLARMNASERAYVIGVERLRQSGELVAPIILDAMKNPARRDSFGTYRRVMRDLGRPMLNPLVVATQMKNDDVLIPVIDALGDLGYDVAVPYLAKLAQSGASSGSVKTAAASALGRLGAGDVASLNTVDLFFELSEKFYYDKASISADTRSDTAQVWFWAEDRGLFRREVPRQIFNEILSKRAAAESLALDGSRGATVSLWLAANNKREAELPEGATDATLEAGTPDAHYYNVSAGTTLLNPALQRALSDKNGAVALKLIKSLQQIVGRSNLFAGDGSAAQPLIESMDFADRLVRINAAFALAVAQPEGAFNGSERVVPLLGEAVSQTGRPNVLLVAPDAILNGLMKELTDQGYGVAGASTADTAVVESAKFPSIDAIVVSEDIVGGTTEIEKLMTLANVKPSLRQTARVIVTKTSASPWAEKAVTDALINTTRALNGAELKPAIESARERSGALPLDEEGATGYALTAANLLERLAIRQSGTTGVYDLTDVESTLLGALNDSRGEVVKSVGKILALRNSKRAQEGLLIKASEDGVADDVKISLYQALAVSGKTYGNLLEPQQVDALIKAVAGATEIPVRSAAAEARGALNLPTDQVKDLIIGGMTN